jgi:hypothetical protein
MTARESLPDALIIGAPKAGTSALHAALAQHPQIHKVDADEFSVEVSYGPDGDAAEEIYDDGLDDVTGVIAKGRQKTGKYGFAVPTKHMDDLVIEVSDYEHDRALSPDRLNDLVTARC